MISGKRKKAPSKSGQRNPDEFTSEDGSLIICSTHGALFELDDGYCSYGPCTGDHLEQVPLEVDGEEVKIGGGS